MKIQRMFKLVNVVFVVLFLCVIFVHAGCQQSASNSGTAKIHPAGSDAANMSENNPAHMEAVDTNDDEHEHMDVSEDSEEVVEEEGGLPPKAFFPETVFDVGELEQGEDIAHTFVVKNLGPGVLRILSAKPS